MGATLNAKTPALSGGHRLYSEHDNETVKWLRTRQTEGLSISRAVELWKEIIEAGHDPLVEYSATGALIIPDHMPVPDTRKEFLRQKWVEANLAFDGMKADEVLDQAFAIYPVETVCSSILQQGISDIGESWYTNQASVQQEHFASAMASRRLETLITATPRPTRQKIILVGCPPGEQHVMSILLLNLFLRRRGLGVVYLGADIPLERLGETSAAIQPDLAILAAQQLSTAATLQSAALMFLDQGLPLAYGGLIFNRVPRLCEHLPAHFLGGTLDEAIHVIEQLVASPRPISTAMRANEIYQDLVRLYREKRFLIEIELLGNLQTNNLDAEHIGEANTFFGNGLSAALELGDPAFLEADLEWVKGLLTGHQIPEERLLSYMAAYRRSVHKVMGDAGASITDWIGSYLAQNETAHL
jgi:methanogenic corrinoid protein MtbC1